MGIHLLFHWIPGHCGHPLGDRVDLLAKSFSIDTYLPSIPCPLVPTPFRLAVSFIKARYKAWVSQLWWENSNSISPSTLFISQPDRLSPPAILDHIQLRPIRTIRCVYRLLLGVPTDNKFLHRCKLTISPNCSFCPRTLDSPFHRILHCPQHDTLRHLAISRLNSLDPPVPFTISSLLHMTEIDRSNRQEVSDIFCDFLEETKLVHLFLFNRSVHPPIPLPSEPLNVLSLLRHSPVPSSTDSNLS